MPCQWQEIPRRLKFLGLLGSLLLATLVVVVLARLHRSPVATSIPPPGPHKAGDVWIADLGGKTTMAMVWCPPGKFMMGSPATEKDRGPNETQHEVTLTQGFWLGQTEVTQAQWQAIMGNNPSCFPEKTVVKKKFLQWEVPVWRRDFLLSRGRLPVEQVSWDDCQEFCQKAGPGFRLPTEAEWEYACRAGSTCTYAGTGVLDDMGWYGNNCGGKTHKVGQKHLNAWGLYDMHGNVCEWCQDWYGEYPAGTVTDPAGPATETIRVLRGGSWDYFADASRAACRSWDVPGFRNGNLGFRVAFAPAPLASESK